MLLLVGFRFRGLLGLPSRNGVFHPDKKQQRSKKSHILCKFDEKLSKFFVLTVIIVEIIMDWSSNHLMQEQKESTKRAAEYEKNTSNALENNSPSN